MSDRVRMDLATKFEKQIAGGPSSAFLHDGQQTAKPRTSSRSLAGPKRDERKRKIIRDKLERGDVLSSLANLSIQENKRRPKSSVPGLSSGLGSFLPNPNCMFVTKNKPKKVTVPTEAVAPKPANAKPSLKTTARSYTTQNASNSCQVTFGALKRAGNTLQKSAISGGALGMASEPYKPVATTVSNLVPPAYTKTEKLRKFKLDQSTLVDVKKKTGNMRRAPTSSMLEVVAVSRVPARAPSQQELPSVLAMNQQPTKRNAHESKNGTRLFGSRASSTAKTEMSPRKALRLAASATGGKTAPELVKSTKRASLKMRSGSAVPVESLGATHTQPIEIQPAVKPKPDATAPTPGLASVFDNQSYAMQKRKRDSSKKPDVPVQLVSFCEDDQTVISDVFLSPAFDPSPQARQSMASKTSSLGDSMVALLDDAPVLRSPAAKRLDSRTTPAQVGGEGALVAEQVDAPTKVGPMPNDPVVLEVNEEEPSDDSCEPVDEKARDRPRRRRIPTDRFGEYATGVTFEKSRKQSRTMENLTETLGEGVASKVAGAEKKSRTRAKVSVPRERTPPTSKGISMATSEERAIADDRVGLEEDARPTRQRNEPDRFGEYEQGQPPSCQDDDEDDFFGNSYASDLRHYPESSGKDDVVGQDGWSARQVGRLRVAHLTADPTSMSFWTDIARIADVEKPPSECQRKWFSLVQTPAARRAPKPMAEEPTSAAKHDDLFESTPFRHTNTDEVNESTQGDSFSFLNIQFGSAIKIGEGRVRAPLATSDGEDEEDSFLPSVEVNKPGYKTYIQGLKRDMNKVAKSKSRRKKKDANGFQLKVAQTISENVFDEHVDLNVRMSPGGTLQVNNDYMSDEDDDFLADEMEE